MGKGRPASAETAYKIIIHTNGAYRYASTKQYTTDESGKKVYKYKHWGTLDDSNKFHPGMNYNYASPVERRKLIFPPDWDLSEATGLAEKKPRGRVAYEADDVDRQYGATWFLDRIAEKTHIREDLLAVFGGNTEMVDDILTMAYFPFVDNLSYSHLAQWQREVKAPSGRKLTSKAVTLLTQSITEQNRMDLFRQRAKRVDKDELCAVDSTSISTYGFNLVDIRWGKNKDHLPLRQTLEVIVYSLTSHMPIYYLELPGNMPDSRTVDLILTELEHAGFKNLILITDRGYESLKNLETYIARGQKMITSVKVTQGEVLKIIKSLDMSMGYPAGMTVAPKEKLYYMQRDGEYAVEGNGSNIIPAKKYKINLYFNPFKRAEDQLAMEQSASEQAMMMDEIVKGGLPVEDTDDTVRRFNLLSIVFNEDGSVASYSVNRDKMASMLLTSGFFASKTFGVNFGPLKAKDNYGMRDEQEKMFGLQKGPLGQDRLRTWSETSKRGRMFICFVGLILASYVRAIHKESTYLSEKFGSVEDIIAEMRTIRCIEHKGRMKFITPFVGLQVDICKEFGIDIPQNCAPQYVSRKKPATPKVGRQANPKTVTQEF